MFCRDKLDHNSRYRTIQVISINYWSRPRNIAAPTNRGKQYIKNLSNLSPSVADDERRVGFSVRKSTIVDCEGKSDGNFASAAHQWFPKLEVKIFQR